MLLEAFLFYFLRGVITAIVALVADSGSTDSWEPMGFDWARLSVWHLTRRQKKHDSIYTLNLLPPDLNNISGQFGFRFGCEKSNSVCFN